ncbi:MAG: hypothetical protein ABF293_02850 [Flavobacteriaceae bacterium]
MFRILFQLCIFITLFSVSAQDRPIRIVEKDIPNRIALYAVNENEHDLDVKLTVSGTNFRQSRAKPRFIRVPATSKVHVKTLVLIRDKEPNYSFKIEVNDSLSNRALKKEYELISIKPGKPVVIYLTPNCEICDSLMLDVRNGRYIIDTLNLAKKPQIKDQLQIAFGEAEPIDSLKTPIINIGGKLYTRIEKYDEILELLQNN